MPRPRTRTSPTTISTSSARARRPQRRAPLRPTVERRSRRSRDIRRVHARGHTEAASPRGARLSTAVRGTLVDGDSVGRLPARGSLEALPADLEGKVRRLHDAARPEADAGPARRLARLALRGRPAHRRGDASAHAPRSRAVRPRAAEPERGTVAARRAVEIWFQGHQVDRRDPLHRAPAAHVLEHCGARRVRLLCECEPRSRSSALEPGERAADRRRSFRGNAADAALQRLRGRCCPLYRGMDLRRWF